jgi:hypothetical protein
VINGEGQLIFHPPHYYIPLDSECDYNRQRKIERLYQDIFLDLSLSLLIAKEYTYINPIFIFSINISMNG